MTLLTVLLPAPGGTAVPVMPCSALQMWKAVVGHDVSVKVEAQSDDWDTDPDFVVSACVGGQLGCSVWHRCVFSFALGEGL